MLLVATFAMATKISILHVNDTHGHAWTDSSNVGGFAVIASMVNEFRAKNPNTLFLHAGDINTGVPESDMIDAASDIVALNLMKLDAMTLGNHEFDKSADVLSKQMKYANFPFLSANIYKDGQPAFTPYIIKEIDGIKVAIVGFTAEETKILESVYAEAYEWPDTIAIAKDLIPELKKQADVVIALTHLGDANTIVGPNSHELAEAVDGIDVIVDGHSHSKYEKPEIVNGTIIVQANEWGKFLGKLDLDVENGGIVFVSYELIPVNAETTQPDFAVATALDYFKKLGDEKLDNIVGKTNILLMGDRAVIRKQDTNLGHMIADAMAWKTGADVVVTNSGGIRASINPVDITYRDVLTVLPFGNSVYLLNATGAQLMEILNYTATISAGQGAWPQVAGVTYTMKGGMATDVLVGGEPVDMDKNYTVVTNNYMASGGDGYVSMKGLSGYDTGFVVADVLMQYFVELGTIESYDETNRITKIED